MSEPCGPQGSTGDGGLFRTEKWRLTGRRRAWGTAPPGGIVIQRETQGRRDPVISDTCATIAAAGRDFP